MSCNKTKNFRLVEIVIGGQDNYITDEKVLDGAKTIKAIEAYRAADCAKTPNGLTVADDTAFEQAFLTLVCQDKEQVLNVPLTSLCKKDNAGELFMIDIPPISSTKSKVHLGSLAGVTTGQVFLIGFHYES